MGKKFSIFYKLNRFKGFNKFNRKNIIAFLDKQGFYIVLFICIGIVGATALWTARNSEDKSINQQMSSGETTQEEQTTGEEQVVESMPEGRIVIRDLTEEETVDEVSEAIVEKPSEEPADKAQDKEDTGTKAVKAASPSVDLSTIIWPVKGEIIVGFGRDTLVYSNTLGYWTVHNGVDIAAPEGTEVKAALAGVVESIVTDPKMGIVITLDHGGGIKTVYANLSTDKMVQEGQTVSKGQTISGVGTTALFEIADPPHLHFEIIKNGEYIDPAIYLK